MLKNAVKSLTIATAMIASASLSHAGSELGFDISVGQMTGGAKELVFKDDGSLLSQLDWDLNNATVINASTIIPIGKSFSFSIEAKTGISGDNYMNDYDWMTGPSTGPVSHHSWHDNTVLDHYFSVDAAVRLKLNSAENTDFSVLAGMHYVGMQFSAYGGCFKYPSKVGCYNDGDPAVTYAQNLPAAYGGLAFSHRAESFSFAGEIKGGVSFNASDSDHHWMTNTNYIDHGSLAPFVAGKAQVGLALGENIDAFISADFQKYFEQKGSIDIYALASGEHLAHIAGDYSGFSWSSVAVSTGVKLHF